MTRTPGLAGPQAVESASPATPSSQAADREKIRRLAEEFESLLIGQMLKDMRRSVVDEEEGEGLGADVMSDTMMGELALALSRSGGFGLADVLARAMDARADGRTPADADSGQAAPVIPRPAPVEQALERQIESGTPIDWRPLEGHRTSAFGVRADPFTGQGRFHKGIDIQMAYGSEVAAAAGGRVAFAGWQTGYGMTLVVDHGSGLQTRYAHLSAMTVSAGDAVAPGAVIGRAGSSGRATGPHLHFEVLESGRPVDPDLAQARLLKVTPGVADY